jgi:hypothetical protein
MSRHNHAVPLLPVASAPSLMCRRRMAGAERRSGGGLPVRTGHECNRMLCAGHKIE